MNSSSEADGARAAPRLLSDGVYCFEQRLAVDSDVPLTIVTCTAWLLELYELHGGAVHLLSGSARIVPAVRRFAVLFPPFSIARVCFKRTTGRVSGFADDARLPAPFAKIPTIFETSERPVFDRADVFELLRTGRNVQPVDLNPRASALSLRAKRMIDASYLQPTSIAAIAGRLVVTAEHLSRQFKRDFAMSPSAYLHQLRIADAPLKLARGEEIAAISSDVGYQDLSRFYRQFRKSTRSSPGACRRLLEPSR